MSRAHLAMTLVAALLAGSMLGRCLAGEASPAPTPEQVRFFEAQVRPTLVEHCQKCHGPDKQKAHLRLDTRAGALAGGDTGPAVVPGNLEESLLLTAISHTDEFLKMPPSKKLDATKVAALTEWVKIGAPWPGTDTGVPPASARKGEYQITDKDRAHWAFRPLSPPAIPAVKDRAWGANPIDDFILDKLEARGMRPNQPATKLELIRRASYDLTGLPPSPQEVDAFVNDASPAAYEALIERLLESPRYGEKWGRHWLDLVRFAETNSYERDNAKPNAWRYRDYVIRALNQDKPYDRFIREQLAGDEFPDADAEAIIATGFYRLGIWDDEPTDREQANFDSLDDIVATTGQVFLGLTIDCARCHDHKLDPIPQKDYYRLVSFFRNITPFRNGGPTDEEPLLSDPGSRLAYEKEVSDLKRKRNRVQAAITALEDEFRARYAEAKGENLRQPDLDDLSYRYYRDTWDRLPNFDSLKPEESGTLAHQRFDISRRTRDTAFGFVFEGTLIVPEDGTYTFYLDSDDGSRLIVGGQTIVEYDGIHGEGKERNGNAVLTAGRVPIRLEYFQRHNGLGLSAAWSGPGVERRSLSASAAPASPSLDKLTPRDFYDLIQSEGPRLLGAERARSHEILRNELKQLLRTKVPVEMALCVTELGPESPETFVLSRGNAHVTGDKVEPAFLSVLGATPATIPTLAPGSKTCGRRRALADWIASPDNPLTARVMANRVWQHHFGRGIVRSPNNFGLQGDKPTHPELLDWLAGQFVRQGWSLKALHRLIMSSNAYRMSSKVNPEFLEKDPVNDLFWRFDMRRLGAEEIRDSILAVTGTLNPKMYGPGIYPEIPAEVMAGQSQPGKGWDKSSPEEQARRSVYVHVKRSLLMPILEGFDLAETDRSTPVRFATTQPTQALGMLNSGFLNRQAEVLASRLRREAGDDIAKQVALALRLITDRPPHDSEVQRGVDLIDTLKTRDGASPDAALKSFCLVVLNLDEFVYLD